MNRSVYKALADFELKHVFLDVLGSIRSGKDSQVQLVRDQNSLREMALKVYKHLDERFITDNQQFLAGRYYRNAGIRKKVRKRNNLGQNILKKVWSKREFVLLKQLYAQGVPVPKVFDWTENSILMEFIGENRSPALQLNEVLLDTEQAFSLKNQLIDAIELLYQNNIVHGDLSQYNVLVHNNKAYLIDFPQAIDIRTNENWQKYLYNDRANIEYFFSKYE